MVSTPLNLAIILAFVGACCIITEAVDLGRVRSRHRRAITADGLTAEKEMALSSSEKLDFEKFKAGIMGKLLCPNMKKDIYLVKFFKGNGMNIDKATKAVEETLEWRKKLGMDTINADEVAKGRQMLEAHTDAEDVQGRTLMYFQAGKWGLLSTIRKGDDKLYERTFYQIFEEAAIRTIEKYEAGKKNAQHVMLVNYEEWTTVEGACYQCVDLVTRLGLAYESKYPHFGHKVILVNVAADFHFFFDLIRIVLTKDTNEKIGIFGRDRAHWEPEVTKLIEKSEIERAINGKGCRPHCK